MDRSHKLDAPNNDELKDIEQLGNRSDISTLYPHAHDQWTGDLIGDEERNQRRQKKLDTISFGIRNHFVTIGLLILLPFIIALLAATLGVLFIDDDTVTMFVIPAIFVFLGWSILTYIIAKKIHTLFYMNAVRTAPYIVTVLLLLAVSVPAFYQLTLELHQERLLLALVYVSALVTVWSVILNFILLRIWTTPVLSGNVKVLCIAGIGLATAATAAYSLLFS